MNLENVLGNIQTDDANLFHGRLLCSGSRHLYLGTLDAVGGRPRHRLRTNDGRLPGWRLLIP